MFHLFVYRLPNSSILLIQFSRKCLSGEKCVFHKLVSNIPSSLNHSLFVQFHKSYMLNVRNWKPDIFVISMVCILKKVPCKSKTISMIFRRILLFLMILGHLVCLYLETLEVYFFLPILSPIRFNSSKIDSFK